MKYAFMSFSCPEADLAEMLSLAREFGFDGVEPRAGSGHAHGVETGASASDRDAIRRQAEDARVALCCIATSCRFADPATADEMIEDARRAIDLAGDLGAPSIRVFGGKLGPGLDRDQAIEQVASALRRLAEPARERGVRVCMETHDDWTDPDHVAAVMRAVDDPALAVNWDIMHPVRTGGSTMDEAFRALQPWIHHVHFHDGTADPNALELRPIGTGDIDHRRAVHLLRDAGYEGYLSGEWINWEPARVHLPRELAAMKRYEEEAD